MAVEALGSRVLPAEWFVVSSFFHLLQVGTGRRPPGPDGVEEARAAVEPGGWKEVTFFPAGSTAAAFDAVPIWPGSRFFGFALVHLPWGRGKS